MKCEIKENHIHHERVNGTGLNMSLSDGARCRLLGTESKPLKINAVTRKQNTEFECFLAMQICRVKRSL